MPARRTAPNLGEDPLLAQPKVTLAAGSSASNLDRESLLDQRIHQVARIPGHKDQKTKGETDQETKSEISTKT